MTRPIKPRTDPRFPDRDPTDTYYPPALDDLEAVLADGPPLPIKWTWDGPGVLHLQDGKGQRIATLDDRAAMLFIHASNALPVLLARVAELEGELVQVRKDFECVSEVLLSRVRP